MTELDTATLTDTNTIATNPIATTDNIPNEKPSLYDRK